MAKGCWHGLVAQAELGATVEVVCGQYPLSPFSVAPVSVVPASQMFCYQSLVHVLCQQLISGPLSAPWGPHCCVGILGKTICSVTAVMPESVMSVIPIYLVGRIDIVVSFNITFKHIGTISVRLHVGAGVTSNVVGTGCKVC